MNNRTKYLLVASALFLGIVVGAAVFAPETAAEAVCKIPAQGTPV